MLVYGKGKVYSVSWKYFKMDKIDEACCSVKQFHITSMVKQRCVQITVPSTPGKFYTLTHYTQPE